MNTLMKTTFRRFAGQVGYIVKNYHAESGLTKFRSNVKPLWHEDSITCNLVQKTIIPLNYVNQKPSIIDKPKFNIVEKIDTLLPEKIDITPVKEIEEPTSVNIVEKKAHKMLRIRHKKMKKHQRRKLRKRMHYVWAKIRRKRETKKETAFRNEIIGKLREAKRFDAEAYVASRLELYRREILPNRIPGGVIMPEFVVREVLQKRRDWKQRMIDWRERQKKMIKERGSLAVSPDDRFN